MIVKNDSPIIWYIPGLYSADDPQEKALQLLQEIYPSAQEITNIIWENQKGVNIKLESVVSQGISEALNDSNPLQGLIKLAMDAVGSISERWTNALNDVEPTSELLSKQIANNLSTQQHQNLILIGHSLGGNIVVRTLANLYRQKIRIRSALLLGAAIDNTNENILFAMRATHKPVYSLVNPEDAALKAFQTITGRQALGTGCKLKYDYSLFVERHTSNYYGHSSVFYLSQWAEINNIRNRVVPAPVHLLEDVVNFLGINSFAEDFKKLEKKERE